MTPSLPQSATGEPEPRAPSGFEQELERIGARLEARAGRRELARAALVLFALAMVVLAGSVVCMALDVGAVERKQTTPAAFAYSGALAGLSAIAACTSVIPANAGSRWDLATQRTVLWVAFALFVLASVIGLLAVNASV